LAVPKKVEQRRAMAQKISRRGALGLGAAALSFPSYSNAEQTSPVFVELFTSQGCSSCPPADKFAEELKNRPDVVVVSFNVDYWDYLGWRDTLAKPEYSQRQYAYAKARGDGAVYTPQMVVNGRTHAVGSNRRDVESQMSDAKKTGFAVSIDLKVDSESITVTVPASPATAEAKLMLMAVSPRVKQSIERGENTDKSIVYTNVVRWYEESSKLGGRAYRQNWDRKAFMRENSSKLVAILQNGEGGEIIGLAQT
jgi:hypothetical protein